MCVYIYKFLSLFQALDNYIEKVKESLEQGLDSQLSSIVKPKIKQPRVAEKNSNKINKDKLTNESNNDNSITSYETHNLSASQITLSVEEKLSIADTSEDTIVTATRESAPEHDSFSSENKSNTICEEVPSSFSSPSMNNSFIHKDSALKEQHIEYHSEKTECSVLKTTDEEGLCEKSCTLETGILQTNTKDSQFFQHTNKLDTSPEMSLCSQASEIMEDLTVDEKSESSNQHLSFSLVKADICNIDKDIAEVLSNEGVEITDDVNLMKSDSTEINLDDDKTVNEIIDEVDGRTASSSQTITFDEKEEMKYETKSEILNVIFNERIDEKSDCNFSVINVDGKESNVLSETFVIDSEKSDLAVNDYSDLGKSNVIKSADILEYITNSIFEQLLNENLCCSNKDKEGGFSTFYKKNEPHIDHLENGGTTKTIEQIEVKNDELLENSLLHKDSANCSETIHQCLPNNIKEKKTNYESITSTFLNKFLDDATDNFLKIYCNKKDVSINHIENLPYESNVQSSEDICANDGYVKINEEVFSDDERNLKNSFIEQINVTQRVQEIMSEALQSAANSETSRLQDFMITAYDISPTEDMSETG